MNLLVLCPHFAPDVAPTGEVMSAIAAALADRGHRLHVVTALPWYRHHKVEDGWGGWPWRTETTDWGWITRLHPFPTDKTNIPARAVAFGHPQPKLIEAITTAEFPTPARRPADSRLDCGKLERVFGLRLPPWEVALERTIGRIFGGG